ALDLDALGVGGFLRSERPPDAAVKGAGGDAGEDVFAVGLGAEVVVAGESGAVVADAAEVFVAGVEVAADGFLARAGAEAGDLRPFGLLAGIGNDRRGGEGIGARRK